MTEPWLPPEHGLDNLGLQRRTARGVSWKLLESASSQTLQILVFMVVVRLLSPIDFGLVALAAVFISFARVFVEQGIGDALIQRPQLTRSQIDTTFWASLAVGLGLTSGLIVLSNPIAAALHEPLLAPILQVLSLTLVLSALSSVQWALLRRELALRSLTLRTIAAFAGAGLVGVTMAYMGFGAWALVGQQLAGSAVSAVALWWVSPWRPGLNVSREHFGELVAFGSNVVASNVLTFVGRNSDTLVIGATLGAIPLGIYAVGYRILTATHLTLESVAASISFPVLSRLQHDPERMRRAFGGMTRSVAVLTLPGYVGLALIATDLTVLLFGVQWLSSGGVASVLFLIGPLLTLEAFAAALLNAAGHPEVVFRYRLTSAVLSIAGFIVAVTIFRDVLAVAVALVITNAVLLPLLLRWMNLYAGIAIGPYLANLRGIALATLAMAMAVLGVRFLLADYLQGGVLLAAEVAAGALVNGTALWLVDRSAVREVAELVGQVFPRAKGARRRT